MIKNVVSSDSKIRIAMVGCGRVSKKHFESIKSHADLLELVSVCDTDANILSENYQKYHLPTYLHLDEVSREREPLFDSINKEQLMSFAHYGFLLPMDTLREKTMIQELWDTDESPWKIWN
tara:strand:+ start:273 stop:635 length:363 start_codon:yes stop_codon:yes gene_type:complete